MTVAQFLELLKQIIEEAAPALAVMLWNYDQSKIDQAKMQTNKVLMELQLEKNHNEIDEQNSGKSDSDIINDAISKGRSGGGQS